MTSGERSSEDTIAEADLCTSPPLSPTAKRLHKANVLAREGKISEHEKIKMKEDVIRSKGPRNRAAAIFVPQVAQTQGDGRSPRIKLPPTGGNRQSNAQRRQQKNKYEGKMEILLQSVFSYESQLTTISTRVPTRQKEETKKPSVRIIRERTIAREELLLIVPRIHQWYVETQAATTEPQ